MINKKIVLGVLLIFTLVMLIGCSEKVSQGNLNNDGDIVNQIEDNPTDDRDGKEDNGIINEYNSLIEKDASLEDIIKFIDENIYLVSKENASIMVDKLEKVQKNNLPKLDEKFYVDSTIQNKMMKLYMKNYDIKDIYNTDDEETKSLLKETKETGYKVETAEGMFFPIINYEFYDKYKPYVTDDMKDYVDIMIVESNEVPAKDAGLVIGWDEVIKRALSQEEFIEKYPESPKIDDIKELYNRYVWFIFYGLDNTPLFDNSIDKEAREIYIEAVENNKDSDLMKHLDEFLNILKNNDYKLSEESDEYRENVVGGII